MELIKNQITRKLCEIEDQLEKIRDSLRKLFKLLEVSRTGTLDGEVRYWIEEKGLTLTKDEEEALVAEVIQRWDMMADEEIEDILVEIREG